MKHKKEEKTEFRPEKNLGQISNQKTKFSKSAKNADPKKTRQAKKTIFLYTASTLNLLIILFAFSNYAVASGDENIITKSLYVKPYKFLTENTRYDRSPSIIIFNEEYWLFYAKSDTENITMLDSYDQELDYYTIHYKHSSTIEGLIESEEQSIALSETSRPQGFTQKTISATQHDGKIYVFSTGDLNEQDASIYYYKCVIQGEECEWAGPYLILKDPYISVPQEYFEFNQTIPEGRADYVSTANDTNWIYLSWSEDGAAKFMSWDGTYYGIEPSLLSSTSGSPEVESSRLSIHNEKIYSAGIGSEDNTRIIIHESECGPIPNFSINSQQNTDSEKANAILTQYGGSLRVLVSSKAQNEDENEMHLEIFSIDNEGNWSLPQILSDARYDNNLNGNYTDTGELWHDIFPFPVMTANEENEEHMLRIIFGSESNVSRTASDGELALISLYTSELSNDSDENTRIYNFVQNANNYANIGDTIYLSPGFYNERLVITKGIYLDGKGSAISAGPESTSIIIRAENVAINNLTIENSSNGITIIAEIDASTVNIKHSTIQGNEAGLENLGTEKVNATHNYWGSEYGPGGIGLGEGDEISGKIIYSPWHTSPSMNKLMTHEVLQQYNDLEFNSIKADNLDRMSIESDLYLIKKGSNGTSLNWRSNNTGIVDLQGNVNRNQHDEEVILTATISKPLGSEVSAKISKNITIIVTGESSSNEESVDTATDDLDIDDISMCSQPEDGIICDLNLISDWTEGTEISWTSSNETIIDKNGFVYPALGVLETILTANVTKGNISRQKTFNLSVLNISGPYYQEIVEAKRSLTLSKILNGNPCKELISGIYLPNTLPDNPGVSIKWTSSDNEIINSKNQTIREIYLNSTNGFYDIFSQDVGISRFYYEEENYSSGPLIGNSLDYFCGSCKEADFSNPTSELDSNVPFCGYDIEVIERLISDRKTVCAKNNNNEDKFDMILKAISSITNCFDSNNGFCNRSANTTAYIRQEHMYRGEPFRNSSGKGSAVLVANISIGAQHLEKKFTFSTKLAEQDAFYDENGRVSFENDTNEIVITKDNINHIQDIIVPDGRRDDEFLTLNFDKAVERINSSVMLEKALVVQRKGVNNYTLNFPQNTVIRGDQDWSGIFRLPAEYNKSECSYAQGEVIYTIRLGNSRRINFSNAVKITIQGIEENEKLSAAYSEEEENPQLQAINKCASEDDYSAAGSDGECFFFQDGTLTIWTYHASIFAAVVTQAGSGKYSSGTGSGGNNETNLSPQDCKESWICSKWSLCSENGTSSRACKDNNLCATTFKKPEETRKCHFASKNLTLDEASKTERKFLFDILIQPLKTRIKEGDSLFVKTTLINFGSFSVVDTNITYTITDSEGSVVYQKKTDMTVDTQKEFIEVLDTTAMIKGRYTVKASLFYPEQKEPAIAEKSFAIGNSIPPSILALLVAIVGTSLYAAFRLLKDLSPKKDNNSNNSNKSNNSNNSNNSNKYSGISKKIDITAANIGNAAGPAETKETYESNK